MGSLAEANIKEVSTQECRTTWSAHQWTTKINCRSWEAVSHRGAMAGITMATMTTVKRTKAEARASVALRMT